MNGDLISRSALIKQLTDPLGYCKYCEDCPEIDCMDCIIDNVIKEAPAVDAVPVVHGGWRFCGADRWNDTYECSVCGKMAMNDTPYCPNCGAKMDGERRVNV